MTNNRVIRWGAALLFGSLLSGSVWAESIQKLGFINTERVWRESRQAQSIEKTLEREFSGRRQALEKIEREGLALEKRVAAEKDAVRRSSLLAKLDAMSREYRIKQAELDEDYNLRRNEEFAALQQNANRVIIDLAKKDGYDLILQDVVFINGKFDITDEVIREMNR
ncbi:OmpH family outer membrane protein [Neisseria leonii]|uniref:OmpH family outer membrane protein n=1 Tax=Neisseria leonii TaxID=2995413 RepID=UPI00237A09EA|nr:OmpH family outer membrane protein [Neisseria sp. 3986]MDD9325836.1 OmpH family outer membrane protein [Neisseria sp. 3986]